MSRVSDALRFVRAGREEAALRERLGALDPAEGLGPAVAMRARPDST